MKWLEKWNRKVVRRRYKISVKYYNISHNDEKRRHDVAYWTRHYRNARYKEIFIRHRKAWKEE